MIRKEYRRPEIKVITVESGNVLSTGSEVIGNFYGNSADESEVAY